MHMVGTTLDVLKGPHLEENHEERVDLQVLVKSYEEDNVDQELIEVERKDEVIFSTRKMVDHIPYGSENKFLIHPLIRWIETLLE